MTRSGDEPAEAVRLPVLSIVNTPLGSGLAIGDRARLTVHRYLDDARGDAPLAIPWRAAGPMATPLDHLCWQSRYAPMVGRDSEQSALLEWALSGNDSRARVLVGAAGAGKSRLAAEVASFLEGQGWAAGVVEWNDDVVWRLGEAGTLVIVDEPPQPLAIDWSAAPSLLKEVARPARPVRLLILSRGGIAAVTAPGWSVQHLQPLAVEAASTLHERIVEHYFPTGVARPARAFDEWSVRNPDTARLPLYAVATAVHVCHPPWDGRYAADGRGALAGLINATWRTLNVEGKRIGLAADVLPLLVALGNACGGLDESDLRRLAAATSLTMAGPQELVDRVERLPMWWRGGRLATCWTGTARGGFLRQAFADAEMKGLGVRVGAAPPITSLMRLVGIDRDLTDAGTDARLCRFIASTLPVRDLDLDLQALDRGVRPGSLIGRLALRAAERGAPAIPVAIGRGVDDGQAEAIFSLARHLAREEGPEAGIDPAREAVRLYRLLLSQDDGYRADLDEAVALLQECAAPR